MRVPGAKSVRRIGARLRCRLVGAGVILGYHRVASVDSDPWSLAVSLEHFHGQMERLRSAFDPTPLRSMTESSGGRSGQIPVAVTFDDGYRDFVEHALPVLEELEIPSTLFVVTGGLGSAFWWDRLAGVLSRSVDALQRVHFEAGGDVVEWGPGEDSGELVSRAYRSLTGAGATERERVLSGLESRSRDAGLPISPAPAVLSELEVSALARHPLVEIGSHTVSHPRLSDLSAREVDDELKRSGSRLEELTGDRVTSFSYPHGATRPGLSDRVAAAGYDRACLSRNGLVSGRSDPLALPRLWPTDLAGPAFSRWLRSWTGR